MKSETVMEGPAVNGLQGQPQRPAALREKDNLRPFCELHRHQGLDVTDASYHVQPSRGFNLSVSLCCTNGGTSPSTDPPNLKTSRTSRELR